MVGNLIKKLKALLSEQKEAAKSMDQIDSETHKLDFKYINDSLAKFANEANQIAKTLTEQQESVTAISEQASKSSESSKIVNENAVAVNTSIKNLNELLQKMQGTVDATASIKQGLSKVEDSIKGIKKIGASG